MRRSNSAGTYTLFVSLYLVILAFFIWLNTATSIDQEKQSKVLASLHNVFSTQDGRAKLNADFVEILTFERVVNDYFNSIGQLSRNEFPIEKEMELTRVGNHLRLSIPTYRFFREDGAEMRIHQRNFLNELVVILKRGALKTVVKVDVTLNSPRYLQTQNVQDVVLDTERVAFIANRLISNGLPDAMLSGRMSFNQRKRIVMDFEVGYEEDVKNE